MIWQSCFMISCRYCDDYTIEELMLAAEENRYFLTVGRCDIPGGGSAKKNVPETG